MFITYVCVCVLPLCCLQTQEPALVRGSLEELCLLLSLKDHLLPQFQDTASLDIFLLLLSDLFPGCNVPELLAHERGQREELAGRADQDREEAGNSARESRAASAMMVVREDMKAPSEGLHQFMCVSWICKYIL